MDRGSTAAPRTEILALPAGSPASLSQVSEMTKGLNEQAEDFRNRPLTSNAYPVLWVDALYEKVRYGGHVVSMAILLVCGVSEEGKREVLAIEPMLEESKESYYETLEASSQGWHEAAHDIAPWLDYFWGALLRAYKEFEERVGTIERGRGAKGDRVRSEILKRQLPFSISEIEEACPGISRDMVRVILRAMKAEGVIAPTGKGRGAKWSQVKAEGNT